MKSGAVPKGLRVAVLGVGKIGGAIVKSLLGCGAVVTGTGRRRETLERISRLGAEATVDNRLAAKVSDVVILSVKPYQLPRLLEEIRDVVEGKIVVSVVAGVRLSTLSRALEGSRVYRAMPNINALIGRSTTAVAEYTGDKRASFVESILSCMGSVYWIPEEWMDVWTALVGSMPAYVAVMIDSLTLGGVSAGLPREVAFKAVIDTLGATAEHLGKRDIHPSVLRDEVTTPAGTTIEGLKVIEGEGVDAALIRTVEAAARRAAAIGEAIDNEVRRSLNLR
ncbi:pyrroline-5-carboxylate reductase [Aeropyrum pernix]|uniref:Pyrroline-5-carboxylate reductase n=1 Tax=Aeropyrum pernix TaxID=56636 RepID=A0A401HBA5_AERPX|nr:pyrroline-5-carboxylate reductase [Aeropyrum pernix]GBF09599.1 pyrroline-5-carboxylate reductase [Aeropyrum pernix]